MVPTSLPAPNLFTIDGSTLDLSSSSGPGKKNTIVWSKEMTMVPIELYKTHEHLFQKVNYKKTRRIVAILYSAQY